MRTGAKQILFLMLVMLVLCSCSQDQKSQPAVKAVKDYCALMQTVYLRQNVNLLAPIATDNELKRVIPVVMALQGADNVMKTEIEQFEVKKTVVDDSAKKATVETTERWKFWWEDRKSGAITKEKKVEDYHLIYSLVDVNGQWKVDRVGHK